MSEHYTASLPRSVTDLVCLHGHVIEESQDRRILEHVESVLAVNAPMGSRLDDLRRTIKQHLNETCTHHWHDDPTGYGGIVQPYRQCLWCNVCEDLPEETP